MRFDFTGFSKGEMTMKKLLPLAWAVIAAACASNADTEKKRGDDAKDGKDYAAAVTAYTAAIEADGTSWKAYNNRGLCYVELNQTDKALADFDKAIEL